MARLAFFGTPEAAVPTLVGLVDAGHDVALVVTRPDKRRGRGSASMPSPVKAAAIDLGIPVTHDLGEVLSARVEAGVVVAYGRIIPKALLDEVPMLNVHFSLLPRWRGAAPVERAVLAGDTETGVSIMRLDEGIDTGPVLARRVVAILDGESAPDLEERLAREGADLMTQLLEAGLGALPDGEPQSGEATYAAKIDPGELRIDWSRSADELVRLIRLGRAWTPFRSKRLLVLRATALPEDPKGAPGTLAPGCKVATGNGTLVLEEVCPEGRRAMSAAEWVRGARLELPALVFG